MDFFTEPAKIIPVIAAILGTIFGVILKRWYDRSRPWVGLPSIQRDDRYLVELSRDVFELLSRFVDLESQRVPLLELVQAFERLGETISSIKATIEVIDTFRAKTTNRNPEDLVTLLEDTNFWSQLNRLNRMFALPLPQEPIGGQGEPLLETEDFTQGNSEERSFLIETRNRRLLLIPGEGPISERALSNTRTLGQVLRYWVEPFCSQIVARVEQKLQSDLHISLELREQLTDLIATRRLLINARIVNLGAAPEHIRPYGALKLASAGREIEPIPVAIDSFQAYEPGLEEMGRMMDLVEGIADKQGVRLARTSRRDSTIPEHVVVRPGDVVALELVTEDPVNDDAVVEALQKGMLSAQLVLERVGPRWRKWLHTKPLIIGMTQNATDRARLLRKASQDR